MLLATQPDHAQRTNCFSHEKDPDLLDNLRIQNSELYIFANKVVDMVAITLIFSFRFCEVNLRSDTKERVACIRTQRLHKPIPLSARDYEVKVNPAGAGNEEFKETPRPSRPDGFVPRQQYKQRSPNSSQSGLENIRPCWKIWYGRNVLIDYKDINPQEIGPSTRILLHEILNGSNQFQEVVIPRVRNKQIRRAEVILRILTAARSTRAELSKRQLTRAC
mmetsp:Transcript_57050/g.150302  ORF Transcript_57050/g.150302 Transcript_57050/m.150302 type:complete len:220 (+) Transcript_57050:1761-2420(+)